MADETLSHNQVEGLLRAMASGKTRQGDRDDAAAAPGESPLERSTTLPPATPLARPVPPAATASPAVVPYDFQRPAPLPPARMQTLRELHTKLASDFAAAATTLLRMKVDVKLRSVEQMSYAELLSGRPAPQCLNVLTVEPLEGNWLLALPPPLTSAVVDRMLGGDGDPGPLVHRRPTEIESRLVSRFTAAFLGQLERAWQATVPLRLTVQRVEADPLMVQPTPPAEPVIAIALEMVLGTCRATLGLGIPLAWITQLEDVPEHAPRQGSAPTAATRSAVSHHLEVAAVELVVTLARSKIRTQDLLDLAVGDVITTEQEVTAPLELAVQGVPKFAVRPGAYLGKKAICVEGLIEPR